ncbi:hypothetical protein SASPL_138608 [Salvia splendens]|uniref:Myb proto-oncogene protein, plant n=1 Tax=Salvia splendens TaxID=180675 RepID=A0A8X8ZEJ7_SALSN|nr:hypothetical protein SASPL_138608 [Salvia splendens]
MGRPPCCDKIGVKKGPWTPEEDIVLVSYIQQHGPGNWRAVPTNTGLLRCSKSCRLRWAAIASYLPERTDNDIKNYWNTHLKKKLGKIEGGKGDSSESKWISKGQWERRLQTDIHTAKQALCEALSIDKPAVESNKIIPTQRAEQAQTTTYASSTENIARLLKKWMNKSPNTSSEAVSSDSSSFTNNNFSAGLSSSPSEGTFHSFNSSNSEASASVEMEMDREVKFETQMPLTFLEKWLLDDAAAQGQDGDLLDMALGETADLS